jgi:hypothetical protein
LRSFKFDEALAAETKKWLRYVPVLGVFAETLEARVLSQLVSFGPIIAIGRPGEFKPPVGAMRFYVSHEIWRNTVEELVPECQLIVWTTGITEGLHWEIKHLLHIVQPFKLLVCVDMQFTERSQDARETKWSSFRAAFRDVFPRPLPEKIGNVFYFAFKEDWTPIPIEGSWRWLSRLRSSTLEPCDIRPILISLLGRPPLSLRDLMRMPYREYFGLGRKRGS